MVKHQLNSNEKINNKRNGGTGTLQNYHTLEANNPSPGLKDTPIKRRTWLATLSASVFSMAVSAHNARADQSGFGFGVYGNGPYGHPANDSDEIIKQISVNTLDASEIGPNSSILNGEVTELEGVDEVTVFFEWGQSENLSNVTDEQLMQSTGEFSTSISGLKDDTEYEFRAIARSEDIIETGARSTFTTENIEDDEEEEILDAIPVISQLSAEDISNQNNPHILGLIEWEATIDEGELSAATLRVYSSAGEVHSWEYDLSGSTAKYTEEVRIRQRSRRRRSREQYTVELAVNSSHGTEVSETTILQSQQQSRWRR